MVLRAICPQESGGRPPRGKAESQEGGKLVEAPQREKQEQVVCNGDGGGREEAEELDGAGGVFARCGRHQYDAPLRPWRYKRAACQRGACFEA
eukprot:6204150-Pleurochrysis_carterae.AAC.6